MNSTADEWKKTFLAQTRQFTNTKKSDHLLLLEKDRKINHGFSTALQSSVKSFQSELLKIGKKQKEKVIKIDEEIRAIREKLN